MDVELPNGKIISGVPEGATRDEVFQKAINAGIITHEEVAEGTSTRAVLKQKLGAFGNPDAMAEMIGSMAIGAAAEPVAGVAGILQSLNPFSRDNAGTEAVEGVREGISYSPQTPEAQKTAGDLSQIVAPVAEGFNAVETTLGESVLEKTGSPELAAIAHTLPTAVLEALGVGLFKGSAKSLPEVATKIEEGFQKKVTDLLEYQTPERKMITSKLKADIHDSDTAMFRLEKGKVKTDRYAEEAIKQGFDKGVIAPIKSSSNTDLLKMIKMTNIMARGVKDKVFATTNRPADVVGQTLMERLNFVFSKNKEAGRSLDDVAKSLKGKDIDYRKPINNFINNLDGMAIKLQRTKDGKIKPIFDGSDIEGLDGPQRVINRIVARMSNTRPPDAYDLHRLKKYIDENVTYGGGGEGLKGKSERVLKSLRRDVDTLLDSKFPEYDKVNTQYADTITAIDNIQDVAGSKVDLTGQFADKAVGQLARGIMSNNKSRVRLYESIGDIEDIAKKYGAKFEDNFLVQSLYADELDRVFSPVARTGFQGQIDQAVQRAASMTSKAGMVDAAVSAAGKGFEKMRGINEENAFRSIKDLLKASAKE